MLRYYMKGVKKGETWEASTDKDSTLTINN